MVAVFSMQLQNENLKSLHVGVFAFQICWLLWGAAEEIHPEENCFGVRLSVHLVAVAR